MKKKQLIPSNTFVVFFCYTVITILIVKLRSRSRSGEGQVKVR